VPVFFTEEKADPPASPERAGSRWRAGSAERRIHHGVARKVTEYGYGHGE
jgi:hypothetical protein